MDVYFPHRLNAIIKFRLNQNKHCVLCCTRQIQVSVFKCLFLRLASSSYLFQTWNIYDLVPKGAHARGYALQLKIKHCWKPFLFKVLCCVLAWMNEYIVQIISATRLWLISRYSHHTLKKRWKMTAKNRHPCTEWFSSLYLQTNRKHMENQSLICTRKTSFYTDNITSTLTIVVFFDQLIANVRPVCMSDVLQTRTENFEQLKNDSIASESPETSRVFQSMHLHYTVILVFFSAKFCTKSEEYFPRSFDTVVISNVPTR